MSDFINATVSGSLGLVDTNYSGSREHTKDLIHPERKKYNNAADNFHGATGHRPWPKGVSPNPRGKPKGRVSLKTRLKQMMNKENADELLKVLWEMVVVDKDIQAIKLVAQFNDDLVEGPAVQINNTTVTIPEELMNRAREYALGDVVDVVALPITASASASTPASPVTASVTPDDMMKRAEEFSKL